MNQRFRSSGVDLPLFSLPGEYGIGSIGTEAKEFVDFLAKSGFSYWSRLPLNPTSFGDSPYSCYATIGLNHYFIDFNDLRDKGLLKRRDRANIDFGSDPRKIDYEKIYKSRIELLKIAYNRFTRGKGDYQRGYISFLRKNQFTDYACYRVLKEINKDCAWKDFKDGYNEYTSAKLKAVRRNHPQKVDFYLWTQYIFLRQWEELKKYANSQGVSIIGERSRYANYDSVDVYRHHSCFELNDELGRDSVCGYPPDIFHDKGQAWGNPIYDFAHLERHNYGFFKTRLDFLSTLYDYVRLDHFRGYFETYVLKNGSVDGRNGTWVKYPKKDRIIKFVSHPERIIAEDVDGCTKDRQDTIDALNLKDRRVLEIALEGKNLNRNRPQNYSYSTISYSSTHDCKPLKGFLDNLDEKELIETEKSIASLSRHFGVTYTSTRTRKDDVKALLELNLASISSIAIQSRQDLLCQGNESRINTPGTVGNNWQYRITKEDLSDEFSSYLYQMNKKYGRCD